MAKRKASTKSKAKKSTDPRWLLQRLSRLAPLTMVGLVVSVGLRIAQQVVTAQQRALHSGAGGMLDDAELGISARLFAISEKLDTAAYVTLPTIALLFLLWVATAHRAAGPSPGLPSIGYAVGSYFIPILNMFVPARHMRSLVDALHANPEPEPPAMTEASYRSTARVVADNTPTRWDRGLVGLWWGSWLVGLLLIAASIFANKVLHLPGTTPRVMGFACITISFASAVPLVWMITERLRVRRGALANATTSSSVSRAPP